MLLVLAVMVSFAANGQKLKKAFDNMASGEYEEAERAFNKAMRKKIEPGVAYYGLAKMYYDTAAGRKNNQKAFDMFQQSQDKLRRADQKSVDKYKETYGIKLSDCDSMMRICAVEDYNEVRRHFDDYVCYDMDTLMRKFVDKYGKKYPDLNERMIFSRDSLDYKIAYHFARSELIFDYDGKTCFRLFNAILDDLRPHPFADSVRPAIKAIQDELYAYVVQDGLLMDDFRWIFDPTYKEGYRYLTGKYVHSKKYPFVADPEDTLRAFRIKQFLADTSSTKYEEANLAKYVEEFAPTEFAFELLKRMTGPYVKKRDYGSATRIYLKYREMFPSKQTIIDRSIGLLNEPNPPEFINPQRFSDEINSPVYRNSYAPIVTPSMNKLYFCQDMDFRDFKRQEDMYVSEFRDGKWQQAQPIKRFATLENNESAEHIYPDENKMVLFYDGYFMVSDIQDDGSWGAPYYFQSASDKYGNGTVNSGSWQADAYFSADGQAMLFASVRGGNVGMKSFGRLYFEQQNNALERFANSDIYVSLRQPDGTWGAPINIGEPVNTKNRERSPRLSPDLKTLFFTSNGHYGIGGLDIYMSRRLSDTSWTQWSEPVNLGRMINTADNEVFFFNAYDGKTVFYSVGSADGKVNEVYTAQLPENLRAETTSILSGIITDNEGKPLHSNIIWEDMGAGTHLGNLRNDPVTGKFSITLPLGRQYEYFIETDGYFPQSGVFDTRTSRTSEYKRDSIAMVSLREIMDSALNVVIQNIFFEFDKSDLKPESMGAIRHVAKFILENPDLKVMISGHTDRTGSDSHNQTLSEQRANVVRSALVELGVPSSKILAKGFGSTKPGSNIDAENRRVEFSIIKD